MLLLHLELLGIPPLVVRLLLLGEHGRGGRLRHRPLRRRPHADRVLPILQQLLLARLLHLPQHLLPHRGALLPLLLVDGLLLRVEARVEGVGDQHALPRLRPEPLERLLALCRVT